MAKAAASAKGDWPPVTPACALESEQDRKFFAALAPLYEQWRAGTLPRDRPRPVRRLGSPPPAGPRVFAASAHAARAALRGQ